MSRPRPRRVDKDAIFGAAVCELLGRRWSPEQVSHELTVRFADQAQRRLCPESIYQAIYDPDTALTRLAKHSLRSHRRRRRRLTQGLERRRRLTQMTMIDQRPSHVEDGEEAGHWEGDLIMGSGNQSAIGTLVERQARFVMLVHLPGEHSAVAVREGVTDAFAHLPASLRGSLTWDQGREMAQHQQIASATGMGVYLCDAHSPWQRGVEREHEWPTAPILSEGYRSSCLTPPPISRSSPTRSIIGLARRWTGLPLPASSMVCCR